MWRTERKISRITLGEALGLTDQQIQKYETGTNRIGASRLQLICKVLEIPVSCLFEGELGSPPGESGMPQDIVDFMESPEGARFVAAFRGSPTARCGEASRGWSTGSLITCNPKRWPMCCSSRCRAMSNLRRLPEEPCACAASRRMETRVPAADPSRLAAARRAPQDDGEAACRMGRAQRKPSPDPWRKRCVLRKIFRREAAAPQPFVGHARKLNTVREMAADRATL